MALVIDEGTTIWLNPNIGVVEPPPAVPLGTFTPIANPQVGHAGGYVMKARVNNTGTAPDSGFAHYYWSIPTTVMTPATSTAVGPAVNFAASPGTRVVSSEHLNPINRFNPPWVNNGHICMLVAITPTSSAPASLNPTLPNVAQRNLDLLPVTMKMMMFSMGFGVGTPDDGEPDEFTLEMVQAPADELKKVIDLFEIKAPFASLEGRINTFGMTEYDPCMETRMLRRARPVVEKITPKAFRGRGLMMAGMLEGDAALVHVIQRRRTGEVVGGVSAIAYATREGKK